MKKILKKISVILLIVSMFFSNFMSVYAYDVVTETIKIGPNLNLIVSIYANNKNGEYIDGNSPRISLSRRSLMKLTYSDTRLVKLKNGYKVAYRVKVEGEIDGSVKAAFEGAGFSVGASGSGKYKIYKFISGDAFFFPPMSKNECDKWGRCIWSVNPRKEVQ